MAAEEPRICVKLGSQWAIKRIRDGSILGYIMDDLVQVIPIGGGQFQGVDKKGRTSIYDKNGCFIRMIY